MATCLLARAASSLLCRKPVYRALADRLIEGYEQELARRDTPPAAAGDNDAALVEDPATPTPPDPRETP